MLLSGCDSDPVPCTSHKQSGAAFRSIGLHRRFFPWGFVSLSAFGIMPVVFRVSLTVKLMSSCADLSAHHLTPHLLTYSSIYKPQERRLHSGTASEQSNKKQTQLCVAWDNICIWDKTYCNVDSFHFYLFILLDGGWFRSCLTLLHL